MPEKQKDVAALQRALKMSEPLTGAGVDLAAPASRPAEVAPPPAPKAQPKPAKLARDRDRVSRHQSRVFEAAGERGPKTRRDTAAPSGVGSNNGVPTGTVKFFDPKKGFGFIVDGRGKDIFVHVSAVQASGLRGLEPGQRVTFDLESGRKGQEAHQLRILK